MFNAKQEAPKAQNPNATNQFCEGTVIEGEVKSTNDIRLDGTIHGNVVSSARVVIGQKGNLDGELRCQNADISGTVKGRVTVQDMLFLKATAFIEGDIIATKLVVEAGARFNGSCSMGVYQMDNGQQSTALKKEAI